MCGRYTHKYAWKQLHRLLNLISPPIEFPERYNVTPAQNAPIVRVGTVEGHAKPGRRVDFLRWGFAPSWSQAIKGKLVNCATAEGVATKPMFRASCRTRRCVVPVTAIRVAGIVLHRQCNGMA